jgi:hypothetical protein
MASKNIHYPDVFSADLLQNSSGQSGWTSPGRRLLASAYESRIVEVQPALLQGLELEQICGPLFTGINLNHSSLIVNLGQLVAVKVTPELAPLIRPGDTLVELDGQPLTHRKQLHHPKGAVQLKLVLSDLFSAPMVHIFENLYLKREHRTLATFIIATQGRNKFGQFCYGIKEQTFDYVIILNLFKLIQN